MTETAINKRILQFLSLYKRILFQMKFDLKNEAVNKLEELSKNEQFFISVLLSCLKVKNNLNAEQMQDSDPELSEKVDKELSEIKPLIKDITSKIKITMDNHQSKLKSSFRIGRFKSPFLQSSTPVLIDIMS